MMIVSSSDGWSLRIGGLWYLIYAEDPRHILIPVDFTCEPLEVFAGELAWELPYSADPIPEPGQLEIRRRIAEGLEFLKIAAHLDKRPQLRERLILFHKIREENNERS